MAVTTGYVGSAGITWSASTTASVAGQSIGTASWDRLVIVAITIEENVTIDSCTIGGVTANVGISVRNTTGTPDNACAFFYLPVATGTTATISVTLSATSSLAGRISVWATTGAYPVLFDSNSAQGAGTTQTLTGVTINTNGAGYWVFNNATAGTATSWTNATSRDDTATATYRHSVADSTTAGTATITADGATANQILAGISFNERPPIGADLLPQYEKPPFPPNMLSLAVAATAGIIFPSSPYVQPAIPDFAHASTTTNYAAARTLYYQAKIAPPPQAPPFVAPTTMDWQQPLSKLPPRTKPTLSQVIYAIPPQPQQFSLFDVQSSYLSVQVLHYQDRFEPVAVIAEDNNQTIDKWQQPLSKAVPIPAVKTALYTPFVPAEAPRVTADEWMQPLSRAVQAPRLNVTQVTYAAAPPVAVNTRTEWDWTASWNVAPPARPVHHTQPFYGFPYEGEDNTRTEWDWTIQWHPAAPARPVHHTQPISGYPYEAEDNTRIFWDWTIQWQGPPRYWPPRILAQPFVPKEATRENTVTPDKWLQAWRGPPRYWPIKVQTPPFVAPPGATNNNITGIGWLTPLLRAVPTPPVKHTQPLYGFPYTATVSPPTTTLEWLQAWKGPPRYRPAKTFTVPWAPGTPQVAPGPTMAVFDVETVYQSRRSFYYQDAVYTFPPPPPPSPFVAPTTMDWQQPLGRLPPRFRPLRTQVIYAIPTPAVASQYVLASLTVAFGEGLRYICKAETTDGFVEQGEQLVGDCEPAFQADAFQADTFQVCEVTVTWGEQAETADPWDEQQQLPSSDCCSDED